MACGMLLSCCSREEEHGLDGEPRWGREADATQRPRGRSSFFDSDPDVPDSQSVDMQQSAKPMKGPTQPKPPPPPKASSTRRRSQTCPPRSTVVRNVLFRLIWPICVFILMKVAEGNGAGGRHAQPPAATATVAACCPRPHPKSSYLPDGDGLVGASRGEIATRKRRHALDLASAHPAPLDTSAPPTGYSGTSSGCQGRSKSAAVA